MDSLGTLKELVRGGRPWISNKPATVWHGFTLKYCLVHILRLVVQYSTVDMWCYPITHIYLFTTFCALSYITNVYIHVFSADSEENIAS